MNIEFHQNAMAHNSQLHHVLSNNAFEQHQLTIIEDEKGLNQFEQCTYYTWWKTSQMFWKNSYFYFDWTCTCNIHRGCLLANKFNNNICTSDQWNYNSLLDALA